MNYLSFFRHEMTAYTYNMRVYIYIYIFVYTVFRRCWFRALLGQPFSPAESLG